MAPDLSVLENRIGYVAQDKRGLVLALTHPSFAHEKQDRSVVSEQGGAAQHHSHQTTYLPDKKYSPTVQIEDIIIPRNDSFHTLQHPIAHNQRLEFLGDAVLQLAVSSYFYRSYPEASEGEMTRWRTEIVREETLVRVAKSLDLGAFLFLGRGELLSGGTDNPSNLADAMEAVLGAIYLDGGFQAASEVVLRLFEPYFKQVLQDGLSRDFKSRVYEWAQSMSGISISFRVLEETGPEHDRRFTIGLFVNDELQAQGEGHSKKDAEQQASRNFMIHKLETE
ncbi:MAG: ribonuclease III [Clostridiaceae bacterium]|nr:ribonuclease III [Clostridiaceae bacterium]